MTDLTKWPRLIVTGEPVTHEQANDILIRTNEWRYFSTNDPGWEQTVASLAAELLDRPLEPEPDPCTPNGAIARVTSHWQDLAAWSKDVGILDLAYLDNERIMSSWIGGPKGWCDWDGRIGCCNYNIGKWPDEDDVTNDLVAIAAAFPYLSMHVQLVTDEGEGELAATWAVRQGKAALVEPAGLLEQPSELGQADLLMRFVLPGGERGVSAERLAEAMTQVATGECA